LYAFQFSALTEKMRLPEILLNAATILLIAACAHQPDQREVIDVNGLIPITDTRTPNARAYKAPAFDRSKYQGIYIAPTTVYSGPEAEFGNISEENRERIASKLTTEMRRVLGSDFTVVSGAFPKTVRLQMTLVGINQSNPVLSTAMRLTPAGLVLSAAHAASNSPAAFTGSINMAAVAYDSETGQVLAAWQAVFSPSALNVSSGLAPLRAAELSTTRAAEAFRDYLLRTRGE
jgi:hypothetical protein